MSGALMFVVVLEARAAPSAADRETARAWVVEGREKRKAGDVAGALERFRAAHRLMNVPTTGLEVGRTEAQLGLLIEARDTLLAVVRLPDQKAEPKAFREARDEARRLAEQLAPRIPTLNVLLSGPTSASLRLRLDDADLEIAQAHLARRVNPGTHTLTLARGDRTRVVTFMVGEAEQKTVALDASALDDPKPAVAAAAGSPKGAPASAPNGAPGVDPHPRGSSLAWVGFGVGVAGLAAGTAAGLVANQKAARLADACLPDGRCPSALHGELGVARTWAHASTGAFVLGGIGLAVGAVSLWLGPGRATRAPLSVGVGLGSIALGGTF